MSVAVQITARAVSPLLLEGAPPHLPLDGFLHRAALLKRHGGAFFDLTPPFSRAEMEEVELPFEKRGTGANWYYAASRAHFHVFGEEVKHWNKRQDVNQMCDRTDLNRMEIGKGAFKLYHAPVVLTHTRFLTWHACCPSENAVAELEELLWFAALSGIGKKAAQGFGQVAGFEVTRAESDESVWDQGGELQRAIPREEAGGEAGSGDFAFKLQPLQPPYWLGPHVVCAVAGDKNGSL